MPIQFRCTTCNQLLSISRKKAGVEILCPKCTTLTRVPQIAEAEEEFDVPSPAPLKAKTAPPVVPQKPAAPRPPVVESQPIIERKPLAAPLPSEEAQRRSPPHKERQIDAAPQSVTTAAGAAAAYNPWTDVDHDEDEYHPTKRQNPPKDELDMTSLVDVTFLLLVFFMITASFTVQKFLQIAAPESDDNAAATAIVSNDDIVGESVVVAVDAQDRITVDDAPVASLADLKKLLETKLRDEQKTDVLIEAEYHATHGTCVAVTDMAIQAGMLHVRRASRRDSDE